jgi:hypothetical protein
MCTFNFHPTKLFYQTLNPYDLFVAHLSLNDTSPLSTMSVTTPSFTRYVVNREIVHCYLNFDKTFKFYMVFVA